MYLEQGETMTTEFVLWTLLAGWLVTLAVDTLPERRSLGETWYWPLGQLPRWLHSRLGLPPAWSQCPQRPLRYGVIWALVLLLGWLAWLYSDGQPTGLILAGQTWFFLAVAVIDLEHRLVLNRMILAAAPLILLGNWLTGAPQPGAALLGAVAGFVPFTLLALLVPGSIGMGDAKLAAIIGLTLGFADVWLALLVGICAGGVAGLVVLVRSRFQPGQTMAYAPYLVLGAWLALYLDGPRWGMALGGMG
jgi:prepilin signal peptidase PulO-like enzyme (type II secretory pathway)